MQGRKRWRPQDNQFISNDLTAFLAESSQSYIGEFASHNRFVENDYGPVDLQHSGIAGAVIQGDSNDFFYENFHGDYPGNTGKPPVTAVLFGYAPGTNGYASEENTLTALRVNNGAIQPCNQAIDMNWEITGVTSYAVPGLSRCDKMPVNSLKSIRAMRR